jgi:hypothetical protein
MADTPQPRGPWAKAKEQIDALHAEVDALRAEVATLRTRMQDGVPVHAEWPAELDNLLALVRALHASPHLCDALKLLWADQVEAVVPPGERVLSHFLDEMTHVNASSKKA